MGPLAVAFIAAVIHRFADWFFGDDMKHLKDVRLWALAGIAVFLIVMWYFFANNVQVRVFQSHATGGLVYCRTGSLPASSHEDLGTASVSESEAVDCP